MNGFEKTKQTNEIVKQNKQQTTAQKILQSVLDNHKIEERQQKAKIQQDLKEEEIVQSTNDIDTFKAVLEKLCSKNISKQAPHLSTQHQNSIQNQSLAAVNQNNNFIPQINQNQLNCGQNSSNLQNIKNEKFGQNSEEQKIQIAEPKQKTFKTQIIPATKKLFDFNQLAQNSKKGKQINENKVEQKEQEIPQPIQKQQSEFENMIGKKLFKKDDSPSVVFSQYEMKKQNGINDCEEEKLDSDFGRSDFYQRFQSQQDEQILSNITKENANQQYLKKPTITELFFMDKNDKQSKMNKVDEDFQFENQDFQMNFIQPKLKQRTFIKNDLNESMKQIQPKFAPIQNSDNSLMFQNQDIQSLQDLNLQNIQKTGLQNYANENKRLVQNMVSNMENDFNMKSELQKIQTPIFGKTFAKMPSVIELDVELNFKNFENTQLISDSQKNRDTFCKSQELENKSLNFYEDSQKYQKSQNNTGHLKNENNINTIQNQLDNQNLLKNIHEKQFFEEEKECVSNNTETLNSDIQSLKCDFYSLKGEQQSDCFMPIIKNRKPSLSQYCLKRQKVNEQEITIEYDLTPEEIEQEQNDQKKSQQELQLLNQFNKKVIRMDEENFEGLDTNYTNASQNEAESANNANYNISTSSRSNIQRISNLSGLENNKTQNEENLEGLGGMSQFDAINHREEMIRDTATVQNEMPNESISNFQLELIHQNSSNFGIENIQSASRRRINSFNRNNQLFNRVSTNSIEIEVQMSENQPQPLRRQNAIIERQSSSLFINQTRNQSFFRQQTKAETELLVSNALREEFNPEKIEIDEQMLSMQVSQLQLVRGIASRPQVPSQSHIVVSNPLIENQANNIIQGSEAQTIEQYFFQQVNQNRHDQNQNFPFDQNLDEEELLEIIDIPQLNRQSDVVIQNRDSQLNQFERYDILRNQQAQIRQRIQEQELANQEQSSSERSVESDNNQQFEIDLEKLRFTAEFQNAHPKWISEIEDVMNQNIFQKCKNIVENLGVLSLLIFTRLFILNETYENELINLEKNKKECQNSEKIWTENLINSCEQISFSKQQKKQGIPCMAQKFLIHLAQRMINIVHFEGSKNGFILEKIKKNSISAEKQLQEEQLWKTFSEIKDKVFPPLEEIYYCIKNKLINKKELILYKMLIDFNEALLSGNSDFNKSVNNSQIIAEQDQKLMNDIFIPCSIKFYKSLSDSEMSELVKKMEQLNTKIYTVIEIENKIQKMKQQMQPAAINSHQPLNIFFADNNIASANSFFEDQITQIVLNPIQYFLKEAPLDNQSQCSQIFFIKMLSDFDCYSYSKKLVKKVTGGCKQGQASQVYIVLNEKEEYLNYYKNMQINARNNSYQRFKNIQKTSLRDAEHLLSPKQRKSQRNLCQVDQPIDFFQDRKVKEKRVSNKTKMAWNKKKNAMMHNGSYFLKKILV